MADPRKLDMALVTLTAAVNRLLRIIESPWSSMPGTGFKLTGGRARGRDVVLVVSTSTSSMLLLTLMVETVENRGL